MIEKFEHGEGTGEIGLVVGVACDENNVGRLVARNSMGGIRKHVPFVPESAHASTKRTDLTDDYCVYRVFFEVIGTVDQHSCRPRRYRLRALFDLLLGVPLCS